MEDSGDDNTELTPEEQARLDESIVWAKKKYPSLRQLIDKQGCFSLSWFDPTGQCPQTECGVRLACSDAYVYMHTPRNRVIAPTVPMAAAGPVGPPKAPVLAGQERGRAIEALLEGLGQPPKLPAAWHHLHFETRYKPLGRLLVSQAPSFTTVLLDGAILLRIWTNTTTKALIDIAPELETLVKTSSPRQRLIPIPPTVLKKSRPCRQRFTLAFNAGSNEEYLRALGEKIRMAFNV